MPAASQNATWVVRRTFSRAPGLTDFLLPPPPPHPPRPPIFGRSLRKSRRSHGLRRSLPLPQPRRLPIFGQIHPRNLPGLMTLPLSLHHPRPPMFGPSLRKSRYPPVLNRKLPMSFGTCCSAPLWSLPMSNSSLSERKSLISYFYLLLIYLSDITMSRRVTRLAVSIGKRKRLFLYGPSACRHCYDERGPVSGCVTVADAKDRPFLSQALNSNIAFEQILAREPY